ncbi:hypothetical protein L615_003900000300 [Nocardioides sp. J9]|uniref:hypothetical protein n=1 Tax=Nocardioides sp. J9 TaxID=935844 RepID=UPI0011A301D5|nr:hypothetical protein [Nocardioides sp. J9]TWG97107.1 hypothetical protein L615_003900000300 [Nocardioides sp. J9]
MEDEIQLISDGSGVAVIGEAGVVEAFLAGQGLESRPLDLPRLGTMLSTGGAVAQAGSEVAAQSGRWVKLTKESASLVKEHGLRESKKSGLSTGVIKGPKGQVKGFVEFARSPGSLLGNPAVLAGAAGMMAQLAMQQTMDEITDYLDAIDRKLDDVLRAQTNQVVARVDAVDLALREAMSVRASVGRVSEVTWSKVQATSSTILETQAYALRQLSDLTDKLERTRRIGDLAKAVTEAQGEIDKWLSVLARCFQLHDAVAVLELDRVLDADPDELDRHRLGLQAARRERLDLFSRCTERLSTRLAAAGHTANARVLLHPSRSPATIEAGSEVRTSILQFHDALGIDREPEAVEARRWRTAASEVRDRAVAGGAEGLGSVRRAGGETLQRARSATGKVASRLPRTRSGTDTDE